MAGGGMKFTGAWDRWLKSTNPELFAKRLKVAIRKATIKNGLLCQAEIRRAIQSREYAPNAVLTLAIKAPKDKALVNTGALFGAITYALLDDYNAFVGVKRSATGKAGESLVNIAAVLHNGATIKVTDAMRAAVFAKMRGNKRSGKVLSQAEPSGPKSDVWVIPPRPFISSVIDRADVQAQVRQNWVNAVAEALLGA